MDFEVEDFHWVPKKCIDLAIDTLSCFAPKLPAAAVLQLLAKLNAVWRGREAEALRAAQQAHKEEMAAYARAVTSSAPHQQIVAQQKLACLKKQLNLSGAYPCTAALLSCLLSRPWSKYHVSPTASCMAQHRPRIQLHARYRRAELPAYNDLAMKVISAVGSCDQMCNKCE